MWYVTEFPASHGINAVYSVEDVRVSPVMKLTMWCAKSRGNHHVKLHWLVILCLKEWSAFCYHKLDLQADDKV